MFYKNIAKLLEYGISRNLFPESERIYTRNLILEMYGELDYDDQYEKEIQSDELLIEEILEGLLSEAVARGFIADEVTEKDLWDSKLMNCLMPRPSTVIDTFEKLYQENPVKATDYYYNMSKNSDYIRTYRVAKDKCWKAESKYGNLDITINLSKPEKDPKAIAAAKNMKSSTYPKCLLCVENEGYCGHMNHPGRSNHRVIPITINETKWGLQYSPYVYYNEHCIVFNSKHEPMKIEEATFRKLLDFVALFPHYFVGSNADLPIVGGSILSHDHFQGGNHTFAMAQAPVEKEYSIESYEDVKVGVVNWPMSVIRLWSKDASRLVELSTHILNNWKAYSDSGANIIAFTAETPHNTITPIVRKRGENFEVDLVLRNNRTSEEFPDGIFHPHQELHHIKKENIGLIEVMGLAVLPARLKVEMEVVREYLLSNKTEITDDRLEKHLVWINKIQENYENIDTDNVDTIIEDEIGKVFARVLEHAGVYKTDDAGREAFERFIKTL